VAWWRPKQREDDRPEFFVLVENAAGGSPYAYEMLLHHLIQTALDPTRWDREETTWFRNQEFPVWQRLEAAARNSGLYSDIYPPHDELRRAPTSDCRTLLAAVARCGGINTTL
jgi:hypothetical protein